MAKAKTTEKANILTKEQLEKLQSIASDIMNIRGELEDLRGQENLSDVMFEVGRLYSETFKCERELDNIVNAFDEDCDECGDDF